MTDRPPIQYAIHVSQDQTTITNGTATVRLAFHVVCEKCGIAIHDVGANSPWELSKVGHWLADHFYYCKGGQPPVVAVPP